MTGSNDSRRRSCRYPGNFARPFRRRGERRQLAGRRHADPEQLLGMQCAGIGVVGEQRLVAVDRLQHQKVGELGGATPARSPRPARRGLRRAGGAVPSSSVASVASRVAVPRTQHGRNEVRRRERPACRPDTRRRARAACRHRPGTARSRAGIACAAPRPRAAPSPRRSTWHREPATRGPRAGPVRPRLRPDRLRARQRGAAAPRG